MKRYRITTTRVMLIDGVEFTPEDTLAIVETDCESVRDVLSMVQFRGAQIVPEEDAAKTAKPASVKPSSPSRNSAEHSAEDSAGDPFAAYSAAVREGLAAAGIATLAQAALYFRDHGSLVDLEGIGKATSAKIKQQIIDAGLPVE